MPPGIGDQYLFGPAILVSPVPEEGASTTHLTPDKAIKYSKKAVPVAP